MKQRVTSLFPPNSSEARLGGRTLPYLLFGCQGKRERGEKVLAIGGGKDTGSGMLLDDECLFSLTPPTTLWPLASLWCQSLR